MRQIKFSFFAAAVLAAVTALIGAGCDPNSGTGAAGANDTAATVNGKAIKMEEVERVIKSQGQGQESKLSPLELAQARLQALQGLIQQEVLFQKAEQEKTIPTDEEVNGKFNELKTSSGQSAEGFEKAMKDAGQTEESVKQGIKRQLAIDALVKKITGKVEPPKDAEIEAFYNGNKEAFVKKRGVKLAAIVIDPKNNGEGDTTVDERSAIMKGNEIIKQLQTGGDFAAIAREKSEDPSRLQGGDLGYVSEEQLKEQFPPQVMNFMNEKFPIGQFVAAPMAGKFYIFKLQERNLKEENMTLESPGVRQQVTDSLVNARKSLLSDSYAAVAMTEAKIVNYLAQKVVENPNEMSGARPAQSAVPAAANTNSNAASNSNASANSNAKANTAASNTKAEEAKPAANTAANTASNAAANSNAAK